MWIMDLHIKPDVFKVMEKKLGKILELMVTGGIYLNRTPMIFSFRSRIDK